MRKSFLALTLALLCATAVSVLANDGQDITRKDTTVHHSSVGDSLRIPGALTLRLATKHQRYDYSDRTTLDEDINSPKSVKVLPNGKKYYVQSLEGNTTEVYDMATHRKLKVIRHDFSGQEQGLWAPSSGFFQFVRRTSDVNHFLGKPVEMTLTHGGRYLWVTYYRRSYDQNAEDPSALAVIDTQTDEIVRMMETGPLPKMIVASANGRWVAVTHWGDNTVGLIDVSSSTPDSWRYVAIVPVIKRFDPKFDPNTVVDRDKESGLKLRGTTFLPGDRYLLVAPMKGEGRIAVIDVEAQKYLGCITGMMGNIRHLVVKGDYLYLSSNVMGYVQRAPLASVMAAVEGLATGKRKVKGWQTCQVYGGARTICPSPSGRYLFVACNTGSRLVVVDTQTMRMLGSITVDSYPVGLDVSLDGRCVFVTSQGHDGKEGSGNAVNVFTVDYDMPEVSIDPQPVVEDTVANDSLGVANQPKFNGQDGITTRALCVVAGAVAVMAVTFVVYKTCKRNRLDA